MQRRHDYFPAVIYPEDLNRLWSATNSAVKQLVREGAEVESEAVARLVVQFYRRGLVDPKKLENVAVLFAQSKLYRRNP
ncbi:hypothetical protein ABID21_003629 [Pseudorhizobium tarimense]|uniref:Uncharacterized protein n=1 Tax=Pseudorhizobium tarimense TaxID=1079109 RepID=A0ABV2HAE2_9HYPH